jgi:CubicO group peptidase (beta-lactamase class C family)
LAFLAPEAVSNSVAMTTRLLLPFVLLLLVLPARAADGLSTRLAEILDEAERLAPLHAVVVAHEGGIVAGRGYNGRSPDRPANIKSASKSIVSALVGIAIDRGVLEGPDQRIAPLLAADLPQNGDPRLREITIGHLLSMQAGLGRTSGANYGRWVASRNWVRAALAMPFDDEPGGAMLYSTGSTHLLSAILTRTTGRSTLELAREWLGPQEGFAIASWDRDPQGIHFGGNNMAMSPRALVAFGELYRNGGVSRDGERLIPEDWIAASFEPRTASRFTGDGYGYGWFAREIAGHEAFYGWGYGGQMIYVVPALELTVAMTSDDNAPAGRTGHRAALHGLLGEIIEAVSGAD